MSPELLQKTGWLQLVAGVVHRPNSPTCNGQEYDYFVSSKGLAEAVVGVAVVEGSGIAPHSPTRIFLKRRMKELKIRKLQSPMKIPATLPAGCLHDKTSADDDLLQFVSSHVADGQLEEALAVWTGCMEDQLIQVLGLEGCEASRARGRANGPRFVIKPALGPSCSQHPRCSYITTAWRSAAGWLLIVQRALGPSQSGSARAASRAKWRLANHRWEFPNTSKHSTAFLQWMREVRGSDLTRSSIVARHRLTATAVAAKATRHDEKRAQAAWHTWIRDGPSKGLGRQHRLSRVAGGWVPSEIATLERDGGDSDPGKAWDDGDEVQEDGRGTPIRGDISVPQSSQQAVDTQAAKWAKEWNVGAVVPPLNWPAEESDSEQLATLTVEVLSRAARTFPEATGLGWDKSHPKALARCSLGLESVGHDYGGD